MVSASSASLKLTCSVSGGNFVGANSFWFNDGRHLVKKGMESNLPTVIVALKYASHLILIQFPLCSILFNSV